MTTIPNQLTDALQCMEERLTQRIRAAQLDLEAKLWPLSIAEIGLKEFREQCSREALVTHDPVVLWHARVARDSEITHPQRKIMDRLLGQFDPSTNVFRPLQFTHLVQEARVGKGRTEGYLAALKKKGMVQDWSDGYRRFIKVNDGGPTSR